jgi:SnoaL-like domain
MDSIERLLIERECERLVYAYCHLIDHGEAGQVGDLFTEDGKWISPEASHEGQAAVTTAFRARQANTQRMSRHICSTPLIEVDDADSATGVTYLQLYRHDGDPGRRISPLDDLPEFVGEYHDTFRRTPQGWRFQTRRFVAVFVRSKAKA